MVYRQPKKTPTITLSQISIPGKTNLSSPVDLIKNNESTHSITKKTTYIKTVPIKKKILYRLLPPSSLHTQTCHARHAARLQQLQPPLTVWRRNQIHHPQIMMHQK